jgi:hypothetical protein
MKLDMKRPQSYRQQVMNWDHFCGRYLSIEVFVEIKSNSGISITQKHVVSPHGWGAHQENFIYINKNILSYIVQANRHLDWL